MPVITAVCAVVLFSPVRADEPKPMKPPVPVPRLVPKCATVIPLDVLEPGEAAAALTKGCAAKGATFVPLPDEKALLVYADAKTTKEIKDALRLLGEPFTAPKKPHVIPVSDLIEVDEAAKTVTNARHTGATISASRSARACGHPTRRASTRQVLPEPCEGRRWARGRSPLGAPLPVTPFAWGSVRRTGRGRRARKAADWSN